MEGIFSLPGLGEVDLESVREQLALLGHDVPDHVISGFLSEMATGNDEAVAALDDTGGDLHDDAYGQEAVQEEALCTRAHHYEEAYYGQHDAYLMAGCQDGGGNWEDDEYQDHGDDYPEEEEYLYEEGDLEWEIGRMQITEEHFRKPMEVKNVWMSPQESNQQRPSTAQGSLGPRATTAAGSSSKAAVRPSRGRQMQSHADENPKPSRSRSLSQQQRPVTAAPKPHWNESTVLPAAAKGRANKQAARPRSAASSPGFKSPKPVAPSNRSYIVRSATSSPANSGPKKVDRVARNRELAEAWGKDKFLQHGGAARSGSRPAANFHNYFAEKHAAAARERTETKRESRAHTARSLEPAQATPSEKRRDGLRFEVRTRMNR